MQKLLLSEKLNERNKSQLNFALAKAYEDIKEFELSYNSFNTANTLYFKTLNYSSEFFTKEVSIFKNFYLKNKKNLTGEKKIGFLESNPIPAKWALHEMGKIGTGIRLPLTALDAQYRDSIVEALRSSGVLS